MSQIKATGGIKVSGGLRAGRFNEPPAWDTVEGSLGTPFESQAFSVIPGATDPDSFPSGGDVDYSLTSGSLPSGLTLNAETGEISGTPTAVGSDTLSSFTLRAEDGPIGANLVGKSVERDFTITVIDDNPPNVSPAAGNIGSVAELTAAALVQITATDPNTVTQSITFSEVGANLTTENLSIDSNGNITGTPADTGGTRTLNFTVRASTATNSTDIAYSITITDNQDPIWVTSAGLLATVDESEAITTITLAATDDNTVSYAVTAGALPGGLTLNSSTGDITGTPSNVASDTTSSFTVRATDTVELDFTDRCFNIKVLNVIANSLRFNDDDNAFLSRTPTLSNRKTWTFSTWVKLGNIASLTYTLFGNFVSSTEGTILRFASDKLEFFHEVANVQKNFITNALFRDPSAWYHIMCAVDFTQATASDRVHLYANGVEPSYSSSTPHNQNVDTHVNLASSHAIGKSDSGTTQNLDGYLSETYFVDGLQLTQTSFGEFDANGDWQPIEYSGAFGTNGFHLTFSDNSPVGDLGLDTSGNANNWTTNNFTTDDQVTDSPTSSSSNYCVLNSIGETLNNYHTFEDGNLVGKQAVINNASISWPGTIYVSSGKWHFEVVATFDVFAFIGIFAVGDEMELFVGQGSGYGLRSSGDVFHDNADQSTGFSGYSTGDRVAVELDLDTNNCEWFVNGSSRGTLAISAGTYTFGVSKAGATSSGTFVCNFGQQGFTDTPTSGFVALNSANLPTPTIANPSDHFNTKLYTGNSTASTGITGIGFQPDLVWIKNRSQTDEHKLIDSVRGATKEFNSDSLNNESTDTNGLTAFGVDGFTLGTGAGGYNDTGESFVAWNWIEGSTPGFDIVSYTGNGTNQTINHGLGAVPDLMIVKGRDLASVKGWRVYHSANTSAPETDHLVLNTTAATSDTSNMWNDTAPTSSVFTVGLDSGVNADTKNYIAYVWAEVEGFSKFGGYTGNGNVDGPFVWCGFKPAYIMIKRTDSADSWYTFDNARETFNEIQTHLRADLTNAESTLSNGFDFISNGFKMRTSASKLNASAGTYIFIAFAESPFKTARSR